MWYVQAIVSATEPVLDLNLSICVHPGLVLLVALI
jgi:hypothetical protein